MAQFNAGLLYDDDLRAEANAAGHNYWPVYYKEILKRMGLPYVAVSGRELNAADLAQYKVLLLPPLPEGYLTSAQVEALSDWVTAGGLLVGFATPGLEELFGIVVEGVIGQMGDEFTPSACIRLCDEEFNAALLTAYERDTALPVPAPMQRISAPGCRELARLLSFFEQDLHQPAVTYRSVGEGAACYWAFDLAQCTWAMQQGRPAWEDFDGDGKLRTLDMVTIRPWSGEVPYADLMMFALRRIIAEHGGVFLHQLPPTSDGLIPDAVFHWGGDDEGATEVQIPAAEFMANMGLPYHINIMAAPVGTHQLPKSRFDRLKELGCETSIHFNFIEGFEHPYAFTKQDLAKQLADYRAAYGETPVCTVFHWAYWTGWAEPARWLAELGLKGDNNRIHWRYPPSNPVNKVGFAFGSAYPIHYYDDHTQGNRRIEFTSQPITAYECGYRRGIGVELSQLYRAIELANFWNLTMNLFFHPVYLTEEEPRAAVREAVAYMEKLGMTPVHFGSDELCLWWHARDASAVEAVERDGKRLSVRTRTGYPTGCIIQLLWAEGEPQAVEVNGQAARYVIREQHNARWLYVASPMGEAEVSVR